MAENEQNAAEGVIESVVEQVAESKAKTHTLLWLAIIVLLVLLTGLLWFAYQEEVKQQTLILTLTSQATVNKNDALANDIIHLKQTSSKQIDALTASNAALASKMTEIAAMQQLTSDDIQQKWVLSEVKFLLKMANQRILLAGDVANAQVALTLADQQLKILADPRLYQLRALIADEQLALEAVVRVDSDGLATQLQSAINGVDRLKILTSNEAINPVNIEAATATETTFKTVATDVWETIMSTVGIQYEEVGSIITLAPEHQYFLYQNLRLKLEAARLALLSARAFIFKSNLLEIESWLQQYFIGGERDAMLATIKEMQLAKITVELPDISTSLIWLQQKGEQ